MTRCAIIRTIQLSLLIACGVFSGATAFPATSSGKDALYDIRQNKTEPDTARLNADFSRGYGLNPIEPEFPVDPPVPDIPIEPIYPPEDEDEIPVDTENKYAVGTPKGTFNVNSMGAAVYNVVIECPNGGTLMPAVSLSYNSQTGRGLAGYGFSIGGLSAITRGGSNLYDDGVLRGITYTDADNLFLDGKRLILQSGTHFCDGAVYTVEGNPYTTVIMHGTCSGTSAGTWLEVHAADGTIYKYGSSASSRLSYINKKGEQRIASWHISYAEDVYQNCITYSYETTNLNIRPTVITYGTNNSVSRGITNTVTFGYRSLGDMAQPFTVEDRQGYADVVLTDITTATNGVTFRRYELKYDEASDKGYAQFSRLVQIDELDRYGKRLSPIKIDWNFIGDMYVSGRSLDVPTKDALSYVQENSRQFAAADLNGDGVSDIIRVSQARIIDNQGGGETDWHYRTLVYVSRSRVGENNTVTYDYPIKFELQETIAVLGWISVIGGTSVLDFDGDGYNDLLFPLYTEDGESRGLILYTLLGKNIKSGNTANINKPYIPLTASTECPLFCTFDADGNGKDDVLFVETSPKNRCYYGKLFQHTEDGKAKLIDLHFLLPSKPEKLFTADYNNDGLTDIILLYNGGYTIYYNNGSTPSGQCFTENNKKTGTDFGNNWRVQQGDFDGDGLMDFVYNVSPETWLRIARNNGDGTFTHGRSEDLNRSDQSTSKDDDKFSILVWDMNSDGKSDVFVSKANYKHHGGISGRNDYTSTTMKWLYSDGTTLKVFKETEKYHPEDATQGYLMLGDFNGDGAVELANYGTMIDTSSETLDEKIHVYSMGTSVPGLGKIKKITDGLGRGIRIQYESAAKPSVYTRADDGAYPLNTYCLPVAVVSSASFDNGAAGIQYLKYRYGGLKLHIAGKGMLGFTEVTKENTTAKIKETQTVVQRDGRHLIPTEVRSVTAIGGSTSETVSRTTVADTGNGNYFAYVSETEAVDLDGNRTVSSTAYDTAKGVVTEKTILYGGDGMYRRTAYSGYEKRGGRWLPATVTATQKHADSAVPFTDVTEYAYDDRGNVTTKMEHSGTDMQLVTSATYDSYGNVLSSQQAGRGVVSVTKHNEYDASGRFVTKTYESPSSAVNTFVYDMWGNLLEESDATEPDNILTTTHTYDGWGRRTSTTEPDGTLTEWSMAWGKSYDFRYCIGETSTSKPWVNTWYDECSRETCVQSIGEKYVDIRKRTIYDKKGNVSRTVGKTGNLTVTEDFTYDERGRMLTSTSSTGKTAEYGYGNRSVVCTVAGRGYTKTYDAWGNVVSSSDPISEVTYRYSSIGKPESVSTNGTEVTMTYDAAGNKTSLTDPDAGTSTYTYAADGRLLTERDGRDVETAYSFDASGRVISSVAGDITTTYTYGTSGFGAQRIIRKETGGNSVEYTYDSYGRVVEERRNIKNQGTYTFSHTYNSDNLLEKTCYPGGLEVRYVYDEFGFRTQVLANDSTLCSVDDYDGLSYTTSFVGGLKVTDTRDERGFMCRRSLLCGTDTLEALSLNYEGSTGNLLSRKRNSSAEETFGYDSLDRLVSVSIGGEETMGMVYAPNGNILNKTGIGNYEYDASYKPHAVIAVENTGNKIPEGPLGTTYNSLGKIKRINFSMLSNLETGNELLKDTMTLGADPIGPRTLSTMGGISRPGNNWDVLGEVITRPYIMDFLYGPDGERWYSSLSNNGRVISSTVYAGDYEKVTDYGVTREFYYLDGNTVVIKQDGVFKSYVAFTDNLGSILAVVDADGNKVFEASYDAWGKQTVALNKIGLKRGYCGHEMLPRFNLINMNGRLYDPDLGRFLSPDNFVQMPDNSQNFNRYSYCLNNPLKYTDPSGEWFGIDDLFIAGVSFVTGYVSNGLQSGHWGWDSVKSGIYSAVSSWIGFNTAGMSTGVISSTTVQNGMLAGLNTFLNTFMPSVNFPVTKHFSFSMSPSIGFGTGGFSFGAGLGMGYTSGDFSIQTGIGMGSNYGGWNVGASYKGYGASYGITTYESGKFHGQDIDGQKLGHLGLKAGNVSFCLFNDLWGDANDRWRTSAAELTIGKFSIGTYVDTNWGKEESSGGEFDGKDKLIGKNKAWINGKVYSAPIWVGYRRRNMSYKLGFSHTYIQSLTQNFVHKYISPTPFFLDYSLFEQGVFYYCGTSNPFTLWNY